MLFVFSLFLAIFVPLFQLEPIMNKDEFCNCQTLTLGKYIEGDSPELDIAEARHLAKAFYMWADLDFFDESTKWLTVKLSYASDSVFAPELMSTIKFFALFAGYSIMKLEQERRPVLDDNEVEATQD